MLYEVITDVSQQEEGDPLPGRLLRQDQEVPGVEILLVQVGIGQEDRPVERDSYNFV